MSAHAAGFSSKSRNIRVPVVLQQDPTECAAAALAMILCHHGRETDLEECRKAVGSGRDGASAHSLATAARSFGLNARGFACDADSIAHAMLPLIAHWEANHFVVVERMNSDGVVVVDPAHGRRRVGAAEFREKFSRIVLAFDRNESFVERRDVQRFTWREYARELLRAPGSRAALAWILIASIVLQVLGLALPILTKIVVDSLTESAPADPVAILFAGVTVWVIVHGLTTYFRSAVLLKLRNRLDAHVMLEFIRHMLALPFRYFQTRTTGDLLSRASSNTVLREIFTAQSVSLLLDGILVVSYLILLWVAAPLFGAIALGVALVQALVIRLVTARMTSLAQQDLRAQSDAQSYLVEVLSGVETLKAAGAEHRAVDKWTALFSRQLKTSLERSHFSVVIETVLGALRMSTPLALLLLGTRMVSSGQLTLGEMLALNALAALFLAPVTSLLSSAQNLQIVGAHLERIGDVLGAEREQDESQKITLPSALLPIEFRDVSFRYSPTSPLALRNVSLTLAPKRKIAFVGPTGSGKSTLGYLLLGAHTATSGEILVDGRSIESLNLREWRRRFGVVLQDAALFTGTLHENIAFHDPSITREDVVRAAVQACIHDEIAAFPRGYDTLLSEGGAGLSGGQKQRLALARALARRPDVLFLDEATSHLDTATEAAIEAQLSRLVCTRIVIAHRLSTIQDADCIFVLRDGEIVESGSHDALVGIDGAYARLVRQAPGRARPDVP